MKLYEGILAGMDKVIEHGDKITDPFNVLEVTDICVSKGFVELLKCLNYDKLINNTANFNFDDYENCICNNLLYSIKTQNIIAKFAWWVCHHILYEQHGNRLIDVSEIMSNDCLYNQLRLYIYTSNVIEYVISVRFTDSNEELQIRFKNKDNL